MKKLLLLPVLVVLTLTAFGQPKPAQKEKVPTAAEMEKMLEAEMKGMSEQEKTQMRQMMKGIMPEVAKKPGSDVITFTDNKKLVPAKDVTRIQGISRKAFTDADVAANTAVLYGKLMAKMPPAEKTIATNVMAKAKTGPLLMEAATISFMQGRNYAAMALALKAVQAEPKNVIYQNNLAAILSQSGYPEKAIPYLRKLCSQFPTNSTVLHNLGYAWLQLGQVDTARRFFAYAAASNPNNPETALCRGVIAELRGDPKKAAEHYTEAFEMAPDPFTETLAKNVKAQGRLDKIDFNKLKSRISIYEYFQKDWIKIPALVDDVAYYENNKAIQNGFSKMFTNLENKIDSLTEASSAELQALADKGETEFVQMMAKENMKGVSMISMPAVYINKILTAHIAKWQESYVTEYQNLLNEIRQRKQVMTRIGNNDKCADHDRKNNAFLQYANPLIRKFHATKIEEARTWLNAFCTWSWYITGNPKNVVLTQCITWTSFITGMYKSAINDQYAIAKSCVNQNGDQVNKIAQPAIPNFTCPAVISIPFGLEELRLSADAVNFDNNSWGIKKQAGANHNLTLAHGVDKNYIPEPGKYGNPATKAGNGSIVPPGVGDSDLMPLSKIMDELTPLSKIPPDELAPLDPSLLKKGKLDRNDLSKVRNAQLTRKLLRELMQAKCPGETPEKKPRKVKFEVGFGPIEFEKEFEVGVDWEGVEWWDEEVRAWINGKGEYRFENGFTVGIGEIVFEDVKTTGPQTAITNGLDPVGVVINFIKGLFD
jgi:tetratricopeptide (TPR) repeat protein